jgi:hypothetical protein
MVMKMQYGMRHHLKDPADEENHFYWDQLFQSNEELETIEQDGRVIYDYEINTNKIRCSKAFDLVFEGIKFAAINNCLAGSSVLNSYRRPDHQGLMVFSYTGKDWTVSMYKNELNEGVDLSLIAVRYGGGGHASACGFRVPNIKYVISPECELNGIVADFLTSKEKEIRLCCMSSRFPNEGHEYKSEERMKTHLATLAGYHNLNYDDLLDPETNPDGHYVTLSKP